MKKGMFSIVVAFVMSVVLTFGAFAQEKDDYTESLALSHMNIYMGKLVLVIVSREDKREKLIDRDHPEMLRCWTSGIFEDDGELAADIKKELLRRIRKNPNVKEARILPRQGKDTYVPFLVVYKEGDERIVKFYPDGTFKRVPSVMGAYLW